MSQLPNHLQTDTNLCQSKLVVKLETKAQAFVLIHSKALFTHEMFWLCVLFVGYNTVCHNLAAGHVE
jgi:hypothetical protein